MASVPRARLLNLMKAQCEIFSTTYNPEQVRAGNLILRQRLRGPTLVKYYPPRGPDLKTMQADMAELNLGVWDAYKVERAEFMAGIRSRGKGAPKKKRTAKEPAAKGKK